MLQGGQRSGNKNIYNYNKFVTPFSILITKKSGQLTKVMIRIPHSEPRYNPKYPSNPWLEQNTYWITTFLRLKYGKI